MDGTTSKRRRVGGNDGSPPVRVLRGSRSGRGPLSPGSSGSCEQASKWNDNVEGLETALEDVSPSSDSRFQEVYNGIRALVQRFDIECVEAVFEQMQERRLGVDELGHVPSDLRDYKIWRHYQGRAASEAKFLCYRPEFAVPPLPLTLVCKAFAGFRQDVREGQPEKMDVDFAEEFWHTLQDPSYVMDHYETVRKMVWNFISGYLGRKVIPYFKLEGRIELDGLLQEADRIIMLLEFKSEAGNAGDPDFQSLDYLLRASKEFGGWKGRQYALVVCMLGPRIEVSAATVEAGKVWAEPLAESKCYGDEEYLISTAKIWRAIRCFVREGYEDVPLVSPPIPWPLSKETNVERLDEAKLVFVYRNNDGEKEVGKFVRRYSLEVHEAWLPFAPKIRGVVPVCDRFRLVRMEYLSCEQGWLPGDEVVKKIRADSRHVAQLAGCIGAALNAGHSKGFVHGDFRLCNIVVSSSCELEGDGYPKYEVKILDFDWSGKIGETFYPRMNKKISWPLGAEYGAQISKAHDMYFKDHLVEQLEDVTASEPAALV